MAFVGFVGVQDEATDITALGDAANTAARLSSAARAGEILTSRRALEQAGFLIEGFESRNLELKGKSQPFQVFVLKA